MTIDEMIGELQKLRERVGGGETVPVVLVGPGENEYVLPRYAVAGDFSDQDGRKYRCALVGREGGEEFTKDGIAHYDWEPEEDRV